MVLLQHLYSFICINAMVELTARPAAAPQDEKAAQVKFPAVARTLLVPIRTHAKLTGVDHQLITILISGHQTLTFHRLHQLEQLL